MSTLEMHEKAIFERLFDRGGYVLDFTNRTFAEFFREHRIDIEAQKYHFNGQSKMKRLRTFWEIEPDDIVGKVLQAPLKYASSIGEMDLELNLKAQKIICRLLGQNYQSTDLQEKENEFFKARIQRYLHS